MKRYLLFSPVILLALILITPVALAGPAAQGGAPPLINYQGYLTDSGSQPLNGTVALKFGLYTASSGGSPLWEETHNSVSVSGGYFSLLLGSVTPLSAANFSGATRYLQISVDTGGGFASLPRQQVAAVPYALQAVEAQNAWSLNGNSGTTPGSHFLGTTDAVSLTLAVNGSPALRLEPATESPNLIGGYSGNSVATGVSGATIGGGGYNNLINRVTADYGTVGGGLYNRVTADYATVGGGKYNTVSGGSATVGGGGANRANGYGAIVGGGEDNQANGSYATVGGGVANSASGYSTTVAGGYYNTASGFAATVSGGGGDFSYANTASGWYATVPGGASAKASHYGEMAYASGRFAANGDAQTSLYVLRRQTTDTTPTELFLDGSSERLTLATDRVLTFDILVVGVHRSNGSSAGYQLTGVIRNIGGATSFVGTPVKTVLAENVSSWDVQVEADNTNDALVIKAQGSTATTIRWVASVRTVEVGR